MNEKKTFFLQSPDGGLVPDLAAYWYLLLDRWKWLAAATILSGAAAITYIAVTPRTYTVQCVVQVEQANTKLVNIQEFNPEEYKTTEALRTVEQALTSSSVLLSVARANNLFDDPDFVGKDGARLTEAQMVKILGGAITVKLRRGTRLVDIVVDDINPARAVLLADSLVQEYVSAGAQQRSALAGGAKDYLGKQAAELKEKLQKAEMALQDYREKHDAVSLEVKQDTVNAKLTQLNTAVTEAENTRIKLESAMKAVRDSKIRKGTDLIEIPEVARLDEIAGLKKDIKDREAEIANLRQRYLELHPKMISAQSALKKVQDNLVTSAMRAMSVIEKSYRAAAEDETNLRKALREQEKVALELSKVSVPYSALQREVEADSTLFQTVLSRMKETQIDQGVQSANIRVIESPVPPTRPSKPRRLRILASALAAGFIIAAGIAIVLDLLDSSFRAVDQTERMLDLPAFGSVPRADKKRSEHRLELIAEPASATAEAFRGFRTSIALLGNHGPVNVVLFTSAAAGEGKSYCAANYAVSLAQQGLRTLLIDADLRRPGLTAIFPETADVPGVSGFLRGDAGMEQCWLASSVKDLCVMPAGRDKAPNPAELLSSGRFKDLIKLAAESFDRVVVDTAPVNAVSDTLLIASQAAVVCLVVRAGRTPRRVVMRARHNLARANATPDGFILNDLPSGRGANYNYYSEGSYSSAGVYGT